MFQDETTDEYPMKQDAGSSESDLELGMYPTPDEADEDSSMDSLGKYLRMYVVSQHCGPKELGQLSRYSD
jgi:hypothetical protein